MCSIVVAAYWHGCARYLMLVCERMGRGALGPRLAQLVGECLMLSIYLSYEAASPNPNNSPNPNTPLGRTNGPLGRTQRTVGASQRRVRRRFAPPNGPLVRPNGVGRGHDEGPNGVGACSTASRRAVDGVEVDPQRRRGVHRGLPNGVGSISRRHVDDPSTPLGSCPHHPQRRRGHPQRRWESPPTPSRGSLRLPRRRRGSCQRRRGSCQRRRRGGHAVVGLCGDVADAPRRRARAPCCLCWLVVRA